MKYIDMRQLSGPYLHQNGDLIIVIDLVDVICAGVMARIVLNKVDYAVFERPIVLVIGLIAIIFVICLSDSSIVYKVISDEML